MSEPDTQNPLAPVALSGQSAPAQPPAEAKAAKVKSLSEIAMEILGGGE